MAVFQHIILSHATYVGPSGATAAATYAFMTSEYRYPAEPRYIETDVIKNQNGKFKYVYDNGPGFKTWAPFSIACENSFATVLGATAGEQLRRLHTMWEHPGLLGMRTPDGTYLVHWGENLEPSFRVFPKDGVVNEYRVVVQFEEASA